MSEIPEGIMVRAEAAYDALGRGSDADAQVIARAILAERKRCVEAVHRAAKDFYGNPDQMYAAARIAAAIEAGA